MAYFRFDSMTAFEDALAQRAAEFGRFTTTPALAARGLGLPLAHVNQLVRRGAVDCVIVAHRWRLLDGEALLRYDIDVRMAARAEQRARRRSWIAARSTAAPVPTG